MNEHSFCPLQKKTEHLKLYKVIYLNSKKGLYIHIPFCVQKCPYCDFNSYSGLAENYIDALIAHAKQFRYQSFNTVYIGGGTPTSIDAQLISKLMYYVFAYFDISIDAEITIEANPATITPETLEIYRKSGINRISIGVQSFSDSVLSHLGRIHSSAEAKCAVMDASAAGFDNISIDLMFSVPGQSFPLWAYDLSYATTLPISHISCYGLKIEPGTKFAEDGITPMPDEEDRKLYHYAVDFLKNHGFEQYEISNFSRDGKYSRHNMLYWTGGEYLGLGSGAHSYVSSKRFSCVESVSDYIRFVTGKTSEVYENITEISESEKLREKVMTGLRLCSGVDIEDVLKLTPKEKLKKYVDYGFMKINKNKIAFTLKGFDVSNSILSEII